MGWEQERHEGVRPMSVDEDVVVALIDCYWELRHLYEAGVQRWEGFERAHASVQIMREQHLNAEAQAGVAECRAKFWAVWGDPDA